jgi:hypothetical protein
MLIVDNILLFWYPQLFLIYYLYLCLYINIIFIYKNLSLQILDILLYSIIIILRVQTTNSLQDLDINSIPLSGLPNSNNKNMTVIVSSWRINIRN